MGPQRAADGPPIKVLGRDKEGSQLSTSRMAAGRVRKNLFAYEKSFAVESESKPVSLTGLTRAHLDIFKPDPRRFETNHYLQLCRLYRQ